MEEFPWYSVSIGLQWFATTIANVLKSNLRWINQIENCSADPHRRCMPPSGFSAAPRAAVAAALAEYGLETINAEAETVFEIAISWMVDALQ